MMKYFSQTAVLLSCFFAAILFSGCVGDESDSAPTLAIDGDQTEVSFVMNVPVASATRALTMNQENAIETLDVIAFTDQSGVATYAYTTHAANLTAGGTNGDKTSAKIYLKKSASNTELYSFLFLANLRTELDNASSSFAGKTRAEILEMITFETSSAWDTSTPRYLPMTGAINNPMLIEQTTNSLGTISMIRSVAAVDVILNPADPDNGDYTAQGFTNFKLQDVKIYNTSQSGYAIPEDSNMSSNIAFQPTLSSSFLVATTEYVSTDQMQLVRAAYVAESANTNRSGGSFVSNIDTGDQTFLVLSGYYNGTLSWYRVDFVKDDTTGERWDILRNFRYHFLVTSVNGSGYSTESEAAASPATNIEVELAVDNEGDNDFIVYNGQYYLSVNETEFSFTREELKTQEDENRLIILTNYSGGWTIESVVDGSGNDVSAWFAINGSTSGTADIDGVVYLYMEANTSGSTRTAYITVKAGTLTQTVTVTQSNASGLWLKVTDASGKALTDFMFESGQDARGTTVTAQDLNITWFPNTLTVDVKIDMVGDELFDFGSGGTIVVGNEGTLAAGGLFTTTIQPNAMTATEVDETTGNQFLSKSSRVTFTLTDTDGSTVTKAIYLSQTNYKLILSGQKSVYLIDGKTNTITARCNAGWKMTVSSAASINSSTSVSAVVTNVIASGIATGNTGGFNTIGEYINFTTSKLAHNGRVIVTYSDIDTPAKFAPVVDTLYFSNWAGSNIYYNGSNMTFAGYDDNSNGAYQGLFFLWGSLWGISPIGNYNSTSTILYPPTGGSQTGGYAFTSIPATSDTDKASMVGSATQSSFTADYTDSWSVATADGKGDICWALTKQGMAPGASEGLKWRMPTYNELYGLVRGTNSTVEPFGGSAGSVPSSAAGTDLIRTGYYVGYYPVAFPLSGYIFSNESLSQYEENLRVWMSYITTSGQGYYIQSPALSISAGGVFIGGHNVRCILMVD